MNMAMKIMRKILGRKGTTIKRGRFSLKLDGALMSRRGHTYARILPSVRIGKSHITGKASLGSRGREIGIYGRRPPISGGASYNHDTHHIRPSLRYRKKKVF